MVRGPALYDGGHGHHGLFFFEHFHARRDPVVRAAADDPTTEPKIASRSTRSVDIKAKFAVNDISEHETDEK